jgi:hypothetical protein
MSDGDGAPGGSTPGRGRDILADRPLDQPDPSRLSPAHPHRAQILDAHREAMAAGSAGYLDPDSGLFVLTATYLRDRGTCCRSGCRHCPYVAGTDPAPPVA